MKRYIKLFEEFIYEENLKDKIEDYDVHKERQERQERQENDRKS